MKEFIVPGTVKFAMTSFDGFCCGDLILPNGYRPCLYYYEILFLRNLLYVIKIP